MKKLLLVIMLFTLVGCEKMTEENGLYVFIKNQDIPPFSLVEDSNLSRLTTLQQELLSFDNIYDVTMVEGKEELLIVYKVKHLNRFKMQAIEKEVEKIAKEQLSEEKEIVVSSDYKIYLETMRLHHQLTKQIDKQELLKKFKSIIHLQKETT